MSSAPPRLHLPWAGFGSQAGRRIAACLALALCLLPIGRANAQSGNATEVEAPFRLRWGETSDRIEALVANAGGKVLSRRPARGGREAIEVSGLPQDGLKKTLFYFKLGALVSVELQYQAEDWSEERYGAIMSDMRRRISERYGDGQQIARRTEKVGVNGVTQTVTGYKWTLASGNVQLIYFSAVDPQNAYRTLSVHYNAF